MDDVPGMAVTIVFALVCGGFVAAVRPPVTVSHLEPPRLSA
jgi:hypothetical protein